MAVERDRSKSKRLVLILPLLTSFGCHKPHKETQFTGPHLITFDGVLEPYLVTCEGGSFWLEGSRYGLRYVPEGSHSVIELHGINRFDLQQNELVRQECKGQQSKP